MNSFVSSFLFKNLPLQELHPKVNVELSAYRPQNSSLNYNFVLSTLILHIRKHNDKYINISTNILQ